MAVTLKALLNATASLKEATRIKPSVPSSVSSSCAKAGHRVAGDGPRHRCSVRYMP